MKLYCFVQADAVVSGPSILPIELAQLSDFELLGMGWRYAECIRPASFADRTEVFLPIQFEVKPTKVICTYTKRNKTQSELDAQNAQKQVEVEADKASRLAYAATFMASEDYAALPEALQLEWVGYVSTVENTVTDGLGDAIWDVWFPTLPPTSINPPQPVVVSNA